MVRPIPDEVWQRLDPRAGVLSRRTAGRMWIAAAVAVVLLVAGSVIWRAGLVVPRLTWPALEEFEENPDWVRVKIVIQNAGWWPVTVEEVGRSGPGLELLGVEGWERGRPSPFPVTLEPHTGVGATLVYRITDCAGYPRGDWPVTAVVHRPWGSMTVDVAVGNPTVLPWQEFVVDTVCRPGGPIGN